MTEIDTSLAQTDAPCTTRRDFLGRTGLTAGSALLLPAFLAACGSSSSKATTSTSVRRGGHLRTAHVGGGDTETLNPLATINYIDVARARQLYEPLYLDFGPLGNHREIPVLAESLEGNASATVWDLKLRRGITFHSGKPFTADDVMYTLAQCLSPKNGYGAYTFLSVVDLARTQKINTYEIRITLTRPIADFTKQLAVAAMFILPEGFTDFNKPNGTGPFTFESWQKGVQSFFRKNPNYHESGHPYVDSVTILAIPDENARLNALLGGEADAVETLSFAQAREQQSNQALRLLISKSASAVPFTMRLDVAPFKDPNVRKAFKYAANRHQLVNVAFLGQGEIGNDLFGRGLPGYNASLPPLPYDPEMSAALLKKAGVPLPLNMTLYTSSAAPGMTEAATAYAEQAKPAGIDIALKVVPANTYFNPGQNRYESASAPFYQSWWLGDFESSSINTLLKGGLGWQETYWGAAYPEWGIKFQQAQGITNPVQRQTAYDALQEQLYELGGYVVWGYSNLVDAYSPKLNGLVGNPYYSLGFYDYKDWWLSA